MLSGYHFYFFKKMFRFVLFKYISTWRHYGPSGLWFILLKINAIYNPNGCWLIDLLYNIFTMNLKGKKNRKKIEKKNIWNSLEIWKQSKGAHIRSKAKWIENGEKNHIIFSKFRKVTSIIKRKNGTFDYKQWKNS